jgi:hypothetical protein
MTPAGRYIAAGCYEARGSRVRIVEQFGTVTAVVLWSLVLDHGSTINVPQRFLLPRDRTTHRPVVRGDLARSLRLVLGDHELPHRGPGRSFLGVLGRVRVEDDLRHWPGRVSEVMRLVEVLGRGSAPP